MNDLATVDQGGALSIEHIKRQVQTVQQVMRDVMIEGEHYGKIPGCGDKAALMKSGAEKLCFTFQLVPEFAIERTDLAGGHREYFVKCRLANRSGQLIAEGVGTCSTMEGKYRYRKAERVCPQCGKPAIMKSKHNPEWYCWTKKDGCGATFGINDPAVVDQECGKVENPDPADCFNTCLKMAKKRAHVDATITATAASDIFAQDIDENLEREDAERAKQAQAAPAPARASDPNAARTDRPAVKDAEAPRPTPAAAAPAPAAATKASTQTPPTASADKALGAGIGKQECDDACVLLRRELNTLGLADVALMVWWSDCSGMPGRHAALSRALDDVRHCVKAVGADVAAELIEDLARRHGFPESAKSTSAETKKKCAQFAAELHAAANGETAPSTAADAAPL